MINKLDDTYTSINETIISKKNATNENIVCLIISIFMFSFRLSLIIDLYNRIPLTANAIKIGIKITFCKSIVTKENIIPL